MKSLFGMKRRTYGLLLDSLRGGYNFEFWEALTDYCQERGVNLIILPVESSNRNNHFAYQQQLVYEFITDAHFDGMIYLTNTLWNKGSNDYAQELLNYHKTIPSISINIDLEGATNTIFNDNESGMGAIMTHLIQEHGYRDIAFIKGIEGHEDGTIRFNTYKKALEEAGIPYRDSYVATGNFFIQSGADAIKSLMDVNKIHPEVIVAANDDMAIGAIQALFQRGYRVPEDIKVVGYDNIKEVRFLESPLTTVRQPLKEMAIQAVDHLDAILNGQNVERYSYHQPEFILRSSCGCEKMGEMAEDERHDRHQFGYKRIDENRTKEQFMIDSLYAVGQATTYKDLSQAMVAELPRIGIKTAFINRYHSDFSEADDSSVMIGIPESSKILCGYQKDRIFDGDDRIFTTRDLIAPWIDLEDRAYILVIDPLFYEESAYGYWIYELGIKIGGLYETVRRHICSAMHSIRLLEERNKANQDLEEAIRKLEATKDQLVHAEKMASLSTLVAGMAHEINTPVGVAVSAASHLRSKASALQNEYTTSGLRKSSFEHFLDVSLESSKILLTNLLKASDLIKSFKNVSADQMSEQPRKFLVRDYLDQVRLSLLPQTKKSLLDFRITCDESFEMDSYPGALSQIITNLVMNSMVHAYEGVMEGQVVLEVSQDDKSWYFVYKDYGRGIEAEALKHIYDPFYTTKRGQGGSGLGLHIVYNIVKETFKGEIACESHINQGTTFIITLPRSV